MTSNKKDDLNFSVMSPANLQKMHMMSFDEMDPST